jgi:Domain of unknown function (DUF4112)
MDVAAITADFQTLQARYRRLRHVAVLMDGVLRVPGTKFRFGLNSLIGLPPAAGDAMLTAISLWIVWQGSKLGLPREKIVRMLGNVAIEAALGSVPVLGDLFDVIWKANLRNLAIIERHLAEERTKSSLRTAVAR